MPTTDEDYKKLVFWGSSDDLIEVDGDIPGCDEYNGENALFDVAGLRVGVSYVTPGVWAIHVAQVDEDVPVQAKDLRIVAPTSREIYTQDVLAGRAPAYSPYSMRLEMLVPPGSHVTKVGNDLH